MAEGKEKKRYYRIDCFIRVDSEEPEVYDNLEDAQADHDQCEMMQPENHYEINECDEHGKDLE